MSTPKLALAAVFLVAASCASALAAQAHAPGIRCANPDALGVSRVLKVGTQGGFAVGLKTYPQTLKLADHEVVLTFDDGPSPETTPLVLDALKAQCVRAVFFDVGRNARYFPNLVRREIAEGHTVGHHTWSHPQVTLRGLANSAARAQIDKGFVADDLAAYGAATMKAGEPAPRVPFFRFPGFADTPALRSWLGARNIGIFGADLWASDWNRMTPETELNLLMKRLDRAGRGIILLHDVKPWTAAMLPRLLRVLKQDGYRIVELTPGPGRIATVPAPAGWKSQTEATLARMMPRLLAEQAREGSRGRRLTRKRLVLR
ncbi:MAG TPA: polysaccharide deacetylase family protein [Beijerinckiaceae bacterium]|nr:polysaccharide deacetylase family protein [Beijerinckiaceae bacterium]